MTDDELADDILTESKRSSGGYCEKARQGRCCSYHEGMADGLDVFLARRAEGA